jgi:hypothetical protein
MTPDGAFYMTSVWLYWQVSGTVCCLLSCCLLPAVLLSAEAVLQD